MKILTPYFYTDGLKSERVITRFLNMDDSAAWAEFFEDEESLRFIPDFGLSSATGRAAHMIGKQIERYRDQRYGLQAILSKETGALIGLCGLLLQNVNGQNEIEIGYHFLKKNWGKGYATEAAQLFKKFAADNSLCKSVISIVDVGNTRSQNVAMRNGMTATNSQRWLEFEVYIYRALLTQE